ncbi:LANO_0G09120g1_1 [Lachancea nothofagi CBS 11611]|uniref:LANO_0G09120g1_1 n=1 Tax=Lachancea nothofagi CBS 11611 TaxID=1266666 RepID=A0A1G4KI73_9SACH|nr:LANO_0G09120g1_1 [Lachancea nothofagi CBS 11611]
MFQDIQLPSGESYKQPLGLFINNEYVQSSSDETIESIDASTGKVIAAVQVADATIDVDKAVLAARKAFPGWRDTPAVQKRDLLLKLASLVEENVEILAQVESLDSGKPIATNAKYDVLAISQVLKYYAGWADKAQGQSFCPDSNTLTYTLHQPLGVVGCIIPFNYPLAMMSWKWTAIATGNTTVFKSAEQTPLSVLFFAKLVKEAGFPPGVFNVISGTGAKVGDAMSKHLGIDKIAFTGSTAVGQMIQKAAAVNLKPLTLECGGKSPNLVFADADFEQAVKWTAQGIFYNMGQICSGTSRCFVQDAIYDKFVDALAKHVEETYIVGPPTDPNVLIGPQISKTQQERIQSYIHKGIDEGCRVALGGLGLPDTIAQSEKHKSGFYVKPTILADVKPDYAVAREEIFGPVLVVGRFSTYDEALEVANDSTYGLGSAIFTQNISQAHKFASQVEAGICYINSSNQLDLALPFGGVKMSGHGRELGEYGLSNFTNVKAVYVNLGSKL